MEVEEEGRMDPAVVCGKSSTGAGGRFGGRIEKDHRTTAERKDDTKL